MKLIKLLLIAIVCVVSSKANAQNNENRNLQEIEYGVKQITRICPTYMWDGWRFRDIVYDKEMNTVCMYIQVSNWNADKENYCKRQGKELSELIIENFKKAYLFTFKDKSMCRDGDYMLYLSVGTLLYKIAAGNTKLQIVLMKSNNEYVQTQIPLVMQKQDLIKILIDK